MGIRDDLTGGNNPIQTRKYRIVNVKSGKMAVLPDGNDGTFVRASEGVGEIWDITQLQSAKYFIKNSSFSHHASSKNGCVTGGKNAARESWRISPGPCWGQYKISDDLEDKFWGLDGDSTPVKLFPKSSDDKCLWTFKPVDPAIQLTESIAKPSVIQSKFTDFLDSIHFDVQASATDAIIKSSNDRAINDKTLVKLVRLLTSPDTGVQGSAAKAVAVIADHSIPAALGSSPIQNLVLFLYSPHVQVQKSGAGALQSIAAHDEEVADVVKAKAIPALVPILSTTDIDTQIVACELLKDLTRNSEGAREVSSSAGARTALIGCLSCSDVRVRKLAARSFHNLFANSDTKSQLSVCIALKDVDWKVKPAQDTNGSESVIEALRSLISRTADSGVVDAATSALKSMGFGPLAPGKDSAKETNTGIGSVIGRFLRSFW